MLYFHGQCEITVKKQAILIYLEFIPDSTGEYATAGFLTEGKKKKKRFTTIMGQTMKYWYII